MIDPEFISAVGLTPSALNWERLEGFHRALYEANETRNLTRVPPEEAGLRHYLDSLLFQDLIPQGSRVLDIGTGPGFPSWPLAWARPDLQVVGLDSNGKMLGFLTTQELPNLTVVQARAEEWGHRESFDVVTGRAVAPLAIQLELSAAFVRKGGIAIPMRLANDDLGDEELKRLGLRRVAIEVRELPGSPIPRVFPVYHKFMKTDRKYPRRWAEMKANPISLVKEPDPEPDPAPEADPT